jgi:hypothetical protein
MGSVFQDDTMPKQMAPSLKPIWAYTYQIEPPQPESLLRDVRAVLARERSDAKGEGRIWEGRVLREQVVTHILVVADSPDLQRGVNGKLEAAFRELGAVVSVTAPLAVADEPPSSPAT